MKKKAKDLKKGDKIKIAGKKATVEEIEISEVAGKAAIREKQGKRKCRIEAKTEHGERIIIIRPDDYPFEII
ncbi:MAG: hypothetical protein IIA87_02590 [Nanoarchaeota archaeon]|nr:hypothetical protein [Nanoarchaeota archaeon]